MLCKRRRMVWQVLFTILVGMALTGPGVAQTTGIIRGTVKDQSGGVIPGVTVVAVNTETGIRRSDITDEQGLYDLIHLPVGHYNLEIDFPGFKSYRRTGLTIDVNSVLQVHAILEVGGQSEVLTVTQDAVHVETADTQLGQTITGQQVVEVPLNGRSYTDLLAIQPGVTPVNTSANPNASSGGAFGSIAVSGSLNPGQFSINGQRESANGFSLNGANVQEGIASGAAVIPNLDSIAEFRILSSNFDAEYGNYSGGLVNVITKSGGREFHGSLFEFLRNTALDARGFFDPERAKFNQNQFGGTFGGPVKQDKIFFFGDYQGGRTVQGIGTGLIPVPSLANRAGDLSDQASALTGTVKGPYLADLLSQRLGYAVSPEAPYYTPGCTTSEQCVFPNAVIPLRAWSVPAQRLLQYIPLPNVGDNVFSTAAFTKRVRDDKGSGRLDANTRLGALSAYYLFDHYNLDDPYPTSLGGANVPGFNARSNGRAQLLTLSATKTFGATTVNELRLSYLRNTNNLGQQRGGVGVSLAAQGLAEGGSGIVLWRPQVAGVASVQFNKMNFGTNPFAILQVNNTYQVADNFSYVIGTHTLKFGGQGKQERVKQDVDLIANGQFQFFGTTTGLDFADFLMGTVSVYQQQFTPVFHEQSKYFGLYAQDSWRARPNLTLNYGLRWDYIQPWSEKDLQTSTLIPGVPSQKFPGAPLGYLLPGDVLPNGSVIPSTIGRTRKNNFSPRIGLAYSPSWEKGFLAKLIGGPGKSSVRAGFGRFFTAIEGLTVAYPTGNPPYGLTYISPEPPLFETPFIGQNGQQYIQQFPVDVPPYNITRQNPDRRDWSRYVPINGAVSYYYQNKTPYSENYFLSLQRQFGANTVLTASYIGSQGHHLMVLLAANPGNPALCLSVSQPDQVMPETPTCGPLRENGVYTRRDGTIIQGTRQPFGNDIGSNAYFYNNGNSIYHALQVSLNHTSKRLTLLGSYTYGKSIDMASNLGEQVYPYDYKLRRAISSFDLKHNFVVSYRVELPFEQLFHRANRLTQGWAISGITRLSTGIPVTLFNFNDNSLIGSQNQGVNGVGSDLPDYTPGPLQINHNPRNGKPYFNTSLFSVPALGTPGTASRRPFYGPGINNFDIALLKETRLTESKALEIRFETFNTFNHAQLYGASSVDGNIDSRTFGRVVSAASPRIAQVALKFRF